jgi:hypothetical protein
VSLIITLTQLSTRANSEFRGLANGYRMYSYLGGFFCEHFKDSLQMAIKHLNKTISAYTERKKVIDLRNITFKDFDEKQYN